MNSVRRFSGTYDIYSDAVTIHGNLIVMGSSATLDITDMAIQDNIIILNDGETGAGVTAGYAGITVDRGSSPDVSIRWNESTDKWQFTNDGTTYTNLGSGGGGSGAAGSDTQIQYNTSGSLDASSNLTYDSGTGVLAVGNISIGADYIQHTSDITVNSPFRMTNMAGSPTAVSSHTTIYANTPGGGGTGLYFVNTSKSDEFVSKTKATVLALIFS